MKEQKVLDKFCRKLVAMDMDIFGLRGMAKDADPDKKSDWITMNGTHIKVGEGETPQEAGKKFAAKKESERLEVLHKSTLKSLNNTISKLLFQGKILNERTCEAKEYILALLNTNGE